MTRTWKRTLGLAIPALTLGALGMAVFAQDSDAISADRAAKMLEKHPEADANGDGVLTREEARAYFQAQGKKGGRSWGGGRGGQGGRPDPAEMLKRHPELDTDGDGVLSDEEMRAGREKLGRGPMSGGPAPATTGMFFNWLLSHFEEADADNNGQLSRAEILTMKEKYPSVQLGGGPGADDERGQRLLKDHPEADTDGDGTLSKEEFEAFRKSNGGSMRQRLLQKHPEADADGDGTLSDEEFKAFRDSHPRSKGRFGGARRRPRAQ